MHFPPEAYTDMDTPNHKSYGRNCGPWSHSVEFDMLDAHRGRFTYESGHEDDRPVSVLFEADIMVDPVLCIVHVYNLMHIEVIDIYFGGPPSNWLRCGTKQVKRATFQYFFRSPDPLHSFMTFFVHQFFGAGWRHGFGFDSRHCDNIRRKELSSARRGGLDSRLPVSVLNTITDRLTDWAVPVTVDDAMAVSKVWAAWKNTFLAPASNCRWHGILSPAFEAHYKNTDQVKKN